MTSRRPLDTRFSSSQWAAYLGRVFTAEELDVLCIPGGESILIQHMAAQRYPVRLYPSTDLPGFDVYGIIFKGRLPVYPPHGQHCHYTVPFIGGNYFVKGAWFAGHGQFAAYEGSWYQYGDDPLATRTATGLELAIVSAAIEQRAAALIAHREWIFRISELTDAADRHEEMAALLAEGTQITDVSCNFKRPDGEAIVNLHGVGGLPVYDVFWHWGPGRELIIDGVDPPPRVADRLNIRDESRPRRRLNPDDPIENVIIELCKMLMLEAVPIPV